MYCSSHFVAHSPLSSAEELEVTDHKVDNREQLEFGLELPAPHLPPTSPAYLNIQGPNQWPDAVRLPDFQCVTTAFQAALKQVAQVLVNAIALSLELPDYFFE